MTFDALVSLSGFIHRFPMKTLSASATCASSSFSRTSFSMRRGELLGRFTRWTSQSGNILASSF